MSKVVKFPSKAAGSETIQPPMTPTARSEFIAMVEREAIQRRPVVVPDDTIDAETLLGMDFPPLEYVIPGYVVEGLTVLAGKPKLGKSWWAYDASIAVATGSKAMGAVDCEQGDVLYLALEDNQRRVKDRILTLCPARKVQGISLERLKVRTLAPRIDTGLIAELDKWRLACERPRLIIIDVFLKVRPPRKKGEDPYSADYDAVTPLQRYASEHRLAVVLVRLPPRPSAGPQCWWHGRCE